MYVAEQLLRIEHETQHGVANTGYGEAGIVTLLWDSRW